MSFAGINYRSTCYIIDRTKILENQGFRACLFYFIKTYGRKYDER